MKICIHVCAFHLFDCSSVVILLFGQFHDAEERSICPTFFFVFLFLFVCLFICFLLLVDS